MRIIIADDSDLILERIQEMLNQFNQVEIIALLKNGKDALKAFKFIKPDLVILDIKMPGLNGLEVLKEIRKEDKNVKIIILTLYASDYYRQLAMQSGANYFFSKVDDFEKIAVVVEELKLNEKMVQKIETRKTIMKKIKREKENNTKSKILSK